MKSGVEMKKETRQLRELVERLIPEPRSQAEENGLRGARNLSDEVVLTIERDGDEVALAVSCEGYGGVIRFPIRYEEAIRLVFKPWRNK